MYSINDLEITRSDEDRFWEKVNVSEEDDCWYWTGASSSMGYYGRFNIRGVIFHSSRVSLALSGIVINSGTLVLHSQKCVYNAIEKFNNPKMSRRCCNPKHLRIGTHKENSRDTIECGTAKNLFDGSKYSYGETHPFAKLSSEDVRNIRNSRLTNKELAILYKVDPSTISKTRSNQRRKLG